MDYYAVDCPNLLNSCYEYWTTKSHVKHYLVLCDWKYRFIYKDDCLQNMYYYGSESYACHFCKTEMIVLISVSPSSLSSLYLSLSNKNADAQLSWAWKSLITSGLFLGWSHMYGVSFSNVLAYTILSCFFLDKFYKKNSPSFTFHFSENVLL